VPTKVRFLKQNKFNDAILFTGLPGIGLVGKITVDYLLKQFNAEKVAEITSDSFPPSVHTKGGLVELIKDEIYLYRFKNRDFLFGGTWNLKPTSWYVSRRESLVIG